MPRQKILSLSEKARVQTRNAQRELAIILPLLVAVLLLSHYRQELFGVDVPVRVGVAIMLLIIGWQLATVLGRLLKPKKVRVNSAAGVSGFFIRLITMVVVIIFAFKTAGLDSATLAWGTTAGAIVLGLAAQQTIGNVMAGMVLLNAKPFEIGDRVRFAGFGMDVEGTVVSQGLLYVVMNEDDDLVLVPNNTALTMSIRPLRSPATVDMTAKLPASINPIELEYRVQKRVNVPTRAKPHVSLEEFTGDEVVMRVEAVPVDDADGAELAKQILEAIAEINHKTLVDAPTEEFEAVSI